MSDTFLTSDLHVDHGRIIELSGRPFADVHDMNEQVVTRWNAVVRPGDDVWILGDLNLGNLNRALGYVTQLHGRKRLLPGNHDAAWKGHKKHKTRPYLEAGIELVDAARFEIAGQDVQASHFPYYGDHHARPHYDAFRPVDHGGWLLHGHVHDEWRQFDRQINVGVDVWDYEPVHIDRIAELITAGPAWLPRLPVTATIAA